MNRLQTRLATLSIATSVFFWHHTAHALCPTPLPGWIFSFAEPPADALLIARNAPFVIALRCSLADAQTDADAGASSCLGTPLDAHLRVHETATGVEVTGALTWRLNTLLLIPDQPLQANSEYRVDADVESGQPDGGMPHREQTAYVVRTNDAFLPAFAVDGTPRITAEWRDTDVTLCDGAELYGQFGSTRQTVDRCTDSSFQNCRPGGTKRVLSFHGSFPSFHGGASAQPYQVFLSVRPPALGQLDAGTDGWLSAGADVSPGEPVELHLIPWSAATYAAPEICVRADALDAARRSISFPERCASYEAWAAEATAQNAEPMDGSAPAGSSPPTGPNGGLDAGPNAVSYHDGCSALPLAVGAAPSSGTLALLASLMAWRRRKRSAQGKMPA